MDSLRTRLHLQGKNLWFVVAALVVLVIIIALMPSGSSGSGSSSGSSSSTALPQTDQQLTAAFGPDAGIGQWSSDQVNAFATAFGASQCLATEASQGMNYWDARQVTAAGFTDSTDFTASTAPEQTLIGDYGQANGTVLYANFMDLQVYSGC